MTNKTASQIDSPGRRAAAYWFEDGLPELLAGLMLLLCMLVWLAGLLKWIGYGIFMVLWSLSFTLFIVAIYSIGWKILDPVKSWLTYPRAGYANPPGDTAPDQDPIVGLLGTAKPSPTLSLRTPPPPKTNVSNFKNRIFIIMGIIGFLSPLCRERWTIALIMLVIALLLLLLTRKDAYAYSWVSVLPVVVAGVLVAILDIPTNIRPVTPMLILTGWLVIRGIWLLVRFLRTHPRSGEFEGGRL